MEMDAGRIFKTGFVVVLLCTISFFVYRNWDFWSGRPVDATLDMEGPYQRPNPNKDDSHKIYEYLFADHRGKLTLTETDDADGKAESLDFVWEEALPEGAPRRGFGRSVIENTLDDSLATVSDPARRFWLRNVLLNRYAGNYASSYVVLAGLDKDQKATEADLRKDLVTQLTLIDDGSKDGTRDQIAFNKLLAAMDAAKANPNKPDADPKKADQIRAVIDLARAYETKMDLQRIKEAQKYVDAVQKLLQPDQIQHVDEFVKKQIDNEQQTGQLPATPGAAAGRRAGAAGGVRGAAGAGGGGAAGGGRAPRQPAPATPATPATPPV